MCFILHPIPVFDFIKFIAIILPAISSDVTIFFQGCSGVYILTLQLLI